MTCLLRLYHGRDWLGNNIAEFVRLLRHSRQSVQGMPSSGMWHRMALVWTDNSEEHIIPTTGWRHRRTRNNVGIAFLCSVLQLLVTASVVRSSLSLFTLEAIRSSETSVLTRVTRHHFPEDGILQCWICFCTAFVSAQSFPVLAWPTAFIWLSWQLRNFHACCRPIIMRYK
jgi:hypothetical protein